jgi:hypothetical protein
MRARSSRLIAACLCATSLCASVAARAQLGEEPDEEEAELHWKEEWPRFRPVEYVVVPSVLALSFGLRFGVERPVEPNWVGGILFDEPAFEALFVPDPNDRSIIKVAGDVPFIGAFLWSTAEPVIAGAMHNWDLANQLFWMNLEAYSVTASVLWVSQLIVRRERPRATMFCGDPATAPEEADCGTSAANQSFIGGHVATTATAAVLTCIHHSELPLYGGGLPEAIPCATWMTGTALVFTARTLNGGHWVTDNIFGLMLGTGAALVPWALHYGMDVTVPEVTTGDVRLMSVTVTPDVTGSGAVVGAAGLF